MLGVLCARHKPWVLTSLILAHTSAAAHYQRRAGSSISLVGCLGGGQRRHHSSACRLGSEVGCASIWHAILPSGGGRFRRLPPFHQDLMKGEGSWNVAWDTRPARWLHRPDSAWLLFGVCACLAAPVEFVDQPPDVAATGDNFEGRDTEYISSTNENSAKYRVTAVKADGRCLFRAVAHVACLRNGEETPNENRQKELADDLRAQVVDELLRRRKDTEGFIEEDFDAYIKRIEQPYVWGGEPELLMASHVLRTPISVFMVDKSSGGLVKIANYGEEYQKDKETPITILFHGYGHYDILDTISDQNDDRVEV